MIFQVRDLPLNIDAMLKSLICDKIKVPHMAKTVYDPSCLRYCSELCGVWCRDLCNKEHIGCNRGILNPSLIECPSSSPNNLDFISYETKEVETFGKGKPFSRVEKIATNLSFKDFMAALRKEFSIYGEHTLSYWYLRATKIEAFSPAQCRANVATITADFGEAIQIVGKRETSDQFYHRPEVKYDPFFFIFIFNVYRCAFLGPCRRLLFLMKMAPTRTSGFHTSLHLTTSRS